MTLAVLPKDAPTDEKSSIDWIAIATLAIGLGALQTVLEEGNSDDWFESRFITSFFVIAAVTLVLFVCRELTSPDPAVALRVLRHRSLWAGSILSVVIGMGLYGALFAIPIFAQTIL